MLIVPDFLRQASQSARSCQDKFGQGATLSLVMDALAHPDIANYHVQSVVLDRAAAMVRKAPWEMLATIGADEAKPEVALIDITDPAMFEGRIGVLIVRRPSMGEVCAFVMRECDEGVCLLPLRAVARSEQVQSVRKYLQKGRCCKNVLSDAIDIEALDGTLVTKQTNNMFFQAVCTAFAAMQMLTLEVSNPACIRSHCMVGGRVVH